MRDNRVRVRPPGVTQRCAFHQHQLDANSAYLTIIHGNYLAGAYSERIRSGATLAHRRTMWLALPAFSSGGQDERLCGGNFQRSEEHTSELQSRRDLLCRLLLEKKNKKTTYQSRRL